MPIRKGTGETMNSFSKNGVVFQYDAKVNCSAEVCVEREIKENEFGFMTRLLITNPHAEEVYLENAYPVCISGLELGGVPSGNWSILNHGRHKNDLPSVCKAGIRNEAFADAVNRLSEEGLLVKEEQDGTMALNGDQIAVLCGGNATLAVSFATADTQFTEIIIPISAKGDVGTICIGGDFNVRLRAGDSIYTDWVSVDAGHDPLTAIDAYAAFVRDSKGVKVPKEKPAIYSTWYYYGRELCEEDVYTNLKGITERKLPFTHFQLDDGWERAYGDWEADESFPSGMTKIAEAIKEHGLQPGIWTCPIISNHGTRLMKEHPDWFLHHTDGTLCNFQVNGMKSAIMDCTNPAVIDWIEQLYVKLKEWGYTYHKLDFTRAFPIQRDVVYHNPYITPVQAYVNAMKAVRRGIGEESYLLICGGLYQPVVGIADGQRTGSDVQSKWLINGTPKIPFTVKQNVLRYFMNEWWHNDPDSLMVRRDEVGYKIPHLSQGLLKNEEAITFTANQYFGGGLLGSTEALDKIEDDRLYLLKHVMPIVPTKVKPLDMMSGERFISAVDVYVEKGWHTVCFVNWTDKPQNIRFTLDKAYVPEGKTAITATFFGKKIQKGMTAGDCVDVGILLPHSTEILKIAPADIPQIIKSDCHFSMGGEVDIVTENGKTIFKANNLYPMDMHYTIAVPDGREVDVTVPAGAEAEVELK